MKYYGSLFNKMSPFNFFLLILRTFISFTKQFFTFHSNRVKCEKQIFLPSVGFEPTTSCIRGKRLTARPQGPHGRERKTPKLIWKYLESIFQQRHPPDTGMQTLAANVGGVVGSNPTEGKKICFSHFTLLEWNVKNCFVKLIKTHNIMVVLS